MGAGRWTGIARTLAGRRLALAGAVVAIVVAGMLLGWRLAGPTERDTALGRVSFEIVPSWDGHAEGYVPIADWGFRADAFTGLFGIRGELRALHRPALLDAAGGDRSVLRRTEEDLRAGARWAIVRAFLWGLGATALLAILVGALWSTRGARPRSLVPATAGAALLAGALSLLVAERSFDDRAFEQPTYYARGSELSQLLAVAERERERGTYGTSVERALRGFSVFLTQAAPANGRGRELILASDVHNNALVLEPLRRLVRGQPVLLAGDFGHDGNEREAELLAPRLGRLANDVLAVSGNHDSSRLMEALSGAGVTVLGARSRDSGDGRRGRAVTVAGLRVAGFPDPLEWRGNDPDDPDRIFSFSELDDGDARFRDAERELRSWFDALPRRPDVVMVHQNGLAQSLARSLWREGYGRPLTVVTGHDHAQHIDRYGSVVVVDGGTVGAGGVFGVGREFAGMAALRFQPSKPVLRTVDLIRVEPLSGQAQAERVVLAVTCPKREAVDEPCHHWP